MAAGSPATGLTAPAPCVVKLAYSTDTSSAARQSEGNRWPSSVILRATRAVSCGGKVLVVRYGGEVL